MMSVHEVAYFVACNSRKWLKKNATFFSKQLSNWEKASKEVLPDPHVDIEEITHSRSQPDCIHA